MKHKEQLHDIMSAESGIKSSTLRVGMRFRDYDSLKLAVDSYSLANNYVYTIKTSRSISLANKTLTPGQKPFCEKLKKASITFACKHYGEFRRRSLGIRPNQRSFKTGCPSFLTASVDLRTRLLVIKRFVEEHNHESGEEIAKCYPERRRLTPQEKQMLQTQLLDEDIKPFTLRQFIKSATNKMITNKDIYNFRTKYKDLEARGLMQDFVGAEPASPDDNLDTESVGEAEYLEEDVDPYESVEVEMDGEQWYAGEVEEEVEVESEELQHQRLLAEEVERVNEAWRCVYNLLEGENKRLKTENARLTQEMNAMRRKRVICHGCSKTSPSSVASPRVTKPPPLPTTPRRPTWSDGATIKVLTKEGHTLLVKAKNARLITPNTLKASPLNISTVAESQTSAPVANTSVRKLVLIPQNKTATANSPVVARDHEYESGALDQSRDEINEAIDGLAKSEGRV